MASKRRSGAEVDGTEIPLADGRAANRPTQGAQNNGGNEHGLGKEKWLKPAKALAFSRVLCYNLRMEKIKELPEKSEEMVTISRAEYEALQAKLRAQDQELENKSQELVAALLKNQWLLEQLRLNRKKQYGSSSEQMDQLVFEQFGRVFNEAEAWSTGVGKKETQVKAHTRKPRSGSIEEVVPEGTPVEVVEHRLEDHSCPECGSEMVEIGKEVRRSLKMEPARFWIREDVYYTYACKVCERETGNSVIVNTPGEPAVLPGSFASPEAIAHLMVQKFVMYSPLYRQEQEWGRQGLKLSRQVMSHWLLRAAENWLVPILPGAAQRTAETRGSPRG